MERLSESNINDKEASRAFSKAVGECIRQRRTERKWTQEKFAHEIDPVPNILTV